MENEKRNVDKIVDNVVGIESLSSWSTTGKVYTNKVSSKPITSTRLPKKTTRKLDLFSENLTWLNSNEAAEYLRLPSVGALRVLVCKRRVPYHKLGRSLRFRKSELDRLLESSRNGGI